MTKESKNVVTLIAVFTCAWLFTVATDYATEHYQELMIGFSSNSSNIHAYNVFCDFIAFFVLGALVEILTIIVLSQKSLYVKHITEALSITCFIGLGVQVGGMLAYTDVLYGLNYGATIDGLGIHYWALLSLAVVQTLLFLFFGVNKLVGILYGHTDSFRFLDRYLLASKKLGNNS